MTPEGRLSAAIDLLHAVMDQPRRPADAISAEFFRARRYIGGGDRRLSGCGACDPTPRQDAGGDVSCERLDNEGHLSDPYETSSV